MKKTVITNLVILLLTPILLESCKNNKEELLYPACEIKDSITVSYNNQVEPILNENCYRCHNTTNNNSFGDNINLEIFDSLQSAIQTKNLVKSIQHNPLVTPMPKNGQKLSDCQILSIETWIKQGALNN